MNTNTETTSLKTHPLSGQSKRERSTSLLHVQELNCQESIIGLYCFGSDNREIKRTYRYALICFASLHGLYLIMDEGNQSLMRLRFN